MSILRRSGCLVTTLLAVVAQLAHAEEAAAVPAQPVAGPPPAEAEPAAAASEVAPAPVEHGFFTEFPVHGYLKSEYRARWTGEDSDHDLYETLSLDLGDPERNRVTAHFLGDVAFDLDGNTSTQGYYSFDSTRDSTGSDIAPLVYSAYLDVHRVGFLGILRIGRQSIAETPENSFFDGLRLETVELGADEWKLGAYGGLPVYLYQDYSPGDFLGGAYAAGKLWLGARARLDWQHIEGHNGDEEFSNSLVGVDAWQSLGRNVDLYAHYTRLDNEDRDILARGTYSEPEWDLQFQASYYQLLDVQENAVIQADAFNPVLGTYQPYYEVRGMVSKGLGDHFNIDAGVDLRRLHDDTQVSTYNHEFERYFATLDLLDLVVKGSSISLTGEKWVSDGTDSDSQGLDITCPIGEKAKASVGTAHYLYKYDLTTGDERDDVQSYYAKLDYALSRAWRFSVDYTYEVDSATDQYNELRCEAICSF